MRIIQSDLKPSVALTLKSAAEQNNKRSFNWLITEWTAFSNLILAVFAAGVLTRQKHEIAHFQTTLTWPPSTRSSRPRCTLWLIALSHWGKNSKNKIAVSIQHARRQMHIKMYQGGESSGEWNICRWDSKTWMAQWRHQCIRRSMPANLPRCQQQWSKTTAIQSRRLIPLPATATVCNFCRTNIIY